MGFEQARDRVLSVLSCDKAMCVVFGSGPVTTRESALEALDQYIAELPASLLFRM